MAKLFFAAKIDSQYFTSLREDWRQSPADTMKLKFESICIPDSIKEKCLNFMRNMGLVFGCIDFIVTQDDKYIFLEINEMGQFLFIEQFNPEFQLLHAFSKFLLSRNPNFVWNAKNNKILSFNDYIESDDYRFDFQEVEKQHNPYDPQLFPDEEVRI